MDTVASKTLFDKLIIPGLDKEDEKIISGFIQEINLDPFGFLLTSDIQVFYDFFGFF